MNTVRALFASALILGACEPGLLHAQTRFLMDPVAATDRKVLTNEKTKVSINGFRFELRPQAYGLWKHDQRFFKFLAEMAKAYTPFLSTNTVNVLYICDPGEVAGGSRGDFFDTIVFGFENFVFLSGRPEMREQHLSQVFLHEFGHKMEEEISLQDRLTLQAIYEKASRWGVDKNNLFFRLFTDYRYGATPGETGHPWDNKHELFASAFMLTLMYPQELESRIAASPKHVRVLAEELYRLTQNVTAKFPRPKTLLASKHRTPLR